MEGSKIHSDDQHLDDSAAVKQHSKKRHDSKGRKGRPRVIGNPLRRGIEEYITKHLPPAFFTEHSLDISSIRQTSPKRFTVYPPLLLLPANVFNATPEWEAFISHLNDDQLQTLYSCIASSFAPQKITHIAINAPISLTTAVGDENMIRSPINLTPLYGDFGPSPSSSCSNSSERQQPGPTESDFQTAFWVHTVQNSGIVQVWAPLYSMFSRGNVVEKARILGLESKFNGLEVDELNQPLRDVSVLDMYAGIGYFVFSYLKRGVERVWAWELNGWSIEGLRRGCEANGWGIKTAKVDSKGCLDGTLEDLVAELSDEDRVVAFQGDNSFAAGVMEDLRIKLEKVNRWKAIRHVNLGLLPSSNQSWESVLSLLDGDLGGWIHIHENVDMNNIDGRKTSIPDELRNLQSMRRKLKADTGSTVECLHVEKVKTYAPGVMHCVFDIYVKPGLHTTIQEQKC